jgi:hypothetical protein
MEIWRLNGVKSSNELVRMSVIQLYMDMTSFSTRYGRKTDKRFQSEETYIAFNDRVKKISKMYPDEPFKVDFSIEADEDDPCFLSLVVEYHKGNERVVSMDVKPCWTHGEPINDLPC